MSHYNYGIINGANESAPKLGAYLESEPGHPDLPDALTHPISHTHSS